MNDGVVLVLIAFALVGAATFIGAAAALIAEWGDRREARKRTKVLAARIHDLAQRIR